MLKKKKSAGLDDDVRIWFCEEPGFNNEWQHLTRKSSGKIFNISLLFVSFTW